MLKVVGKGGPGSLDYFFLYSIVNADSQKKLLEGMTRKISCNFIHYQLFKDRSEGWKGLKLKAFSKACNNNTIDWW